MPGGPLGWGAASAGGNPRGKSLEDWNRERAEEWAGLTQRRPRPNGLACPECEGDLYDSRPDVMLMSNPPKQWVHCPACGWEGTRIA